MMGPLTESWFFGGDDDMTSALETGFICIRFSYTSSANGKRRLLHHNSRNRPTRSKIPQRHSRASKGDSARLAKAIPQGKGRLGMALTLQRMCLYFVHKTTYFLKTFCSVDIRLRFSSNLDTTTNAFRNCVKNTKMTWRSYSITSFRTRKSWPRISW